MPARILLVEDDPDISEMLTTLLEMEGYLVKTSLDGKEGLHTALAGDFDALILDIMLPGLDGIEVLRQYRARKTTPVMMLTARGEDVDRIIGFEVGADDYVPKPFNPRELIARLKAMLRRVALDRHDDKTLSGESTDALVVSQIAIHRKARTVHHGDLEIPLTQAEFDILACLAEQHELVVSKAQLCEQVLHRRLTLYDRAIDVHISNLRKKLQCAGVTSPVIKTVRGIGYALVHA